MENTVRIDPILLSVMIAAIVLIAAIFAILMTALWIRRKKIAPLALIKNGKLTISRIVYSDIGSDAEKKTAEKIAEAIGKLAYAPNPEKCFQIELAAASSVKKYKKSDIEILIGHIPGAYEDHDIPLYDGYSLKLVGNKLVLFGYDGEALECAASELVKRLGEAYVAQNGSLSLAREGFDTDGNIGTMLAAIPFYDGGNAAYTYKVGNGAKEIVVKETNSVSYNAYLEKLLSFGYTKITSSVIANNEFAVLSGTEYTINVGFYANEHTVRIIIEPLTEPFAVEAGEYTAVTTPQITELGLGYFKSDGTPVNTGACIIFRMSDGRFIVIDGGHNRSECATQLISELRRQSADYAKTDKDIRIAAWILTHAHGDHVGLFRCRTSELKGITIENVLLNFGHPDEVKRAKAARPEKFSDKEGAQEAGVLCAVKELGTNLRIVHPGHIYRFADAVIETLYTSDMQNASEPYVSFNSTSMVMKITLGGTIYMSLADASVQVFKSIYTCYGDYMKADIVQIAHHGFNLAGPTEYAEKAYLLMTPPTVFWTQNNAGYERCRDRAYSLKLTSPEHNPNIKEVLLAGECGDRITLPVPYTPGNAEIVRDNRFNLLAPNP